VAVSPSFLLVFTGLLAVGMAMFREVYPDWRAGYARAAYDLLLIAITLFFTLGMVFYLTTVGRPI